MALSIYSYGTCPILSLLSAAVWSLRDGNLRVAHNVRLNFCLLCLLELKGLITCGHIKLSIDVDLSCASKLLDQLMIHVNLSSCGHVLQTTDFL